MLYINKQLLPKSDSNQIRGNILLNFRSNTIDRYATDWFLLNMKVVYIKREGFKNILIKLCF
ncbi:hypothetical protein NIES4071_08890 [Calothrix sp. NIES-4071]|nr:hypothetical protein NIES4071_08890 [Calothrix sp. NIES-4071]BAZ55231.1 hypothetical protein NIES4105_08850 [Calothrix sp. NIES-4105]